MPWPADVAEDDVSTAAELVLRSLGDNRRSADEVDVTAGGENGQTILASADQVRDGVRRAGSFDRAWTADDLGSQCCRLAEGGGQTGGYQDREEPPAYDDDG